MLLESGVRCDNDRDDSSDNAAMIGSQAYYEYQAGTRGKTLQNAYATADIGKNICD